MARGKSASAIMRGDCRTPGRYTVSAPSLGCVFEIDHARNGWDALDQAKGCNKSDRGSLGQLDLRGRTRGWVVTKIEPREIKQNGAWSAWPEALK